MATLPSIAAHLTHASFARSLMFSLPLPLSTRASQGHFVAHPAEPAKPYEQKLDQWRRNAERDGHTDYSDTTIGLKTGPSLRTDPRTGEVVKYKPSLEHHVPHFQGQGGRAFTPRQGGRAIGAIHLEF